MTKILYLKTIKKFENFVFKNILKIFILSNIYSIIEIFIINKFE